MKGAQGAAIQTKIKSAPKFINEHVIHFVDWAEKWALCEERLRSAVIVGVDTETRPVFTKAATPNRTSLLQLAVRDAEGGVGVFILDLLALKPEWYNAALSELFQSEKIIKLGQKLSDDLKELSASYPSTSCFTEANAVVEVNALSNALAGPHRPLSLQKLAFFYLNKTLSKSQQTSNWDSRPLSLNQLHYAASDAVVLLEMFDELTAHLDMQSMGTFHIQSVMRTLATNTPTMLACSTCSAQFESKILLNGHKIQCRENERQLTVCIACDRLLLLDAAALDAHRSACFEYH